MIDRKEIKALRRRYDALRQKMRSPAYRRWYRKTRTNHRAYKKVLRGWERKFAAALLKQTNLIVEPIVAGPRYRDPDVVLEHFLSWALSARYGLWCDGVDDLRVSVDTHSKFSVTGLAWLGPADDVAKGCKTYRMNGVFVATSRRPRLRCYDVRFEYGEGLALRKAAI